MTRLESVALVPHALEVLKLTGGAGPFDEVVFDLPVDLRASLVAAIDQIVNDRGVAWPGYFAGWGYKDDVLSVTVYWDDASGRFPRQLYRATRCTRTVAIWRHSRKHV